MMNSSAEQLQIAYEIAMSIGNSLDMATMLRACIPTLLRKLNCAAGVVQLLSADADGRLHFNQVYAVPRNIDQHPAFSQAQQQIATLLAEETPEAIFQQLPFHGQVDPDHHFYLLGLPDRGVVLLFKRGDALATQTLHLLKPLLAKLANACNACLQEEQLTVAARFAAENPEPILQVDRAGHLRYGNPASQALLADYGVTMGGRLPPAWADAVALALTTNSRQRFEVEQGARTFAFIVAPIQPAGYANLYGYEITEQRLAEVAWREAEQQLRTVVENTPMVVFALDVNGIFTLSEGRSLAALGRQPGQVIGQSIFEVYRNQPAILDRVRRALRGEASALLVEVAGVPFESWYEPIFDPNGHVRAVVGVAHDVSQQRKAELTLKAVLDTVGEGIITIDATGVIVMINQAVQQIWGYTDRELIGTNLAILMPEQHRAAHRAGLARYLATGQAHVLGKRFELEGLRRDGTTFPLELYITETRVGDRLLFTAAVRDVTERYALEQMRNEFVATVSHELRTPLASLMGFTETLLGERPGPLTAIQKRFLNHSYQNARRLQLLIEELLTVSRIQQGTFKIYQQPFLPNNAIENVKAIVTPLAEAKAIHLSIEDQWSAALPLFGDQNRLEQVLINLISNAIKFTPTDGIVHVMSTQEAYGWQVKVRDTGIGIPATEIPKLFTRFTRASNAVAEQVPGTGLGLYVCKAIIEQHGGQIGLESREGEGATAWFTVPLTDLPSNTGAI